MAADTINLDDLFSGDPKRLEAYVKATESLNIAIDALIKITKAGSSELTKLKEAFEVSSQSTSAQQKQIEKLIRDFPKLKSAFDDLNGVQEKATATQKKANQLTEAELRLKIEQQQELAKTRKAIRDEIKERDAQAGSLNALRIQLNKARQEFDSLNLSTEKGEKRSKELRDTIKQLDGNIRDLEESTGRMQRNVGNYTDSIKEALAESGAFSGVLGDIQGGFQAAGKGLKAATFGFKGLKGAMAALIAIPVVAVISALALALTKTQAGADFVERVIARLNATFNVLIDRSKIVADAFVALLDGDFSKASDLIAKSISGVTDEIVAESRASDNLTKDLQKLRRQEIALIEIRQKLISEFERAQLLRDDETRSLDERIALNEKALKIAAQLRDEELKTQNQRVAFLEAQAALRGGESELLEAELQELAEARARIFEIEDEFISREAQLVSDRNSFRREQARNVIESELAIQRAGIIEKLREVQKGSQAELELREQQLALNLEEIKRFNELENTEDALTKEELLLKEKEFLTARKELRDQYRASEREAEEEFNAELDAELDALIARESELVVAQDKKAESTKVATALTAESIKTTLLAQQAEEGFLKTILNNIRDLLKAKFAEFLATQLAKSQIGPPASLFILPIAGAILTGLFNKLIPAFKDGTNFSPDGLALVGEEGFELAEKNGKFEMLGANGAELTNLQRGTKIYPHEQSLSILESIQNQNNVASMLADTAKENQKLMKREQQFVFNYNTDEIAKAFSKALDKQPKNITNIDEKGFTRYLQNKAMKTKILNRKNSL